MDVRRRLLAATAVLGCAALIAPAGASATNIPVTTTADVSADDEVCSLREAIQAAQTNAAVGPINVIDCPAGGGGGDDEIQLAAATYTITGAANENLNATGDFDLSWTGDIQGYLYIEGALGPNGVPQSVIDASDVDRIFDIQDAGTSELTIRDVILRNGAPPEPNSDGGAVLVRDDDTQFDLDNVRIEGSDALRWGGGFSNVGGGVGLDIDITRTEFSGNTADDEGGGAWFSGPTDYGTLVRKSAFVGNSTDGMGGAIYVEADTTPPVDDGPVVEVENTTLSGNSAATGGGALAFDFGLAGTAWFRFSTLFGNTTPTPGGGGGIATDDGDQFVLFQGGNIVSGNTAAGASSNCSGPGNFDSLGRNIESSNSCELTGTGDLVNTDPRLAPLAYNAGGIGTTRTHGLYDGSPAIDLVPVANCSGANGKDQRDVNRPAGGACDAGAFEGSVGPAPSTAPPTTTPVTPVASAKKCKKKKKKKKGKSAVTAKMCKKKKKKK